MLIRRGPLVALLLGVAALPARADLLTGSLNASLDSGSLAGVMFPVMFSYDSADLNPVGESFVTLASFDFVLLGVPFTRNDIFQGGQAIFENGVIDNVTASFQVILPPNSPVDNITFGFGGPGVIGYADRNNQPGSGTFTLVSSVPEVGSVTLLAPVVALLLATHGRLRKLGGERGADENKFNGESADDRDLIVQTDDSEERIQVSA